MPKKENKNEVPSLKLYIDTCIFQGALSQRSEEDTIFMNKINEKNWEVYTSIHTLMELFDIAKERKFLMKSVIDNWIDTNTFTRGRGKMNLTITDLDDVTNNLNNFFLQHKKITLISLEEVVWDDVKWIVEKSNLHSSDALHLSLAWMYDCDKLVTHDEFFIKEGNKLLSKVKKTGKLKICDVSKVEVK